jgi:hypothetical protein
MFNIVADVKFYETKDGGIKSPLTMDAFKTPMKIGDEYADAILEIQEYIPVMPGTQLRCKILFASPEEVKKRVKTGGTYYLWMLRIIGEVTILEMND